MNNEEIKTLQDKELEQVDGGRPIIITGPSPKRLESSLEDYNNKKLEWDDPAPYEKY